MTPLRDIQLAFKRSLLESSDNPAVAFVEDDYLSASERLNIYRNTCAITLTNALRLAYPAVERLVGAEFFEGAAHLFIREHFPHSAYLNRYGAEFPNFLAHFDPAASVQYLSDVAELEWAVNCALHAPDMEPLALAGVANVPPAGHDLICFEPHPSVRLVRSDYPVDAIWRAVLAKDEEALSRINLAAGPIWLIVERGPDGVDVIRTEEAAWVFADELIRGRPLGVSLRAVAGIDASALLAEHLTAGRFVGFHLAPPLAKAVEKLL